MDATNERHIFDLLLKEATKHGSAQYLFVTPKVNINAYSFKYLVNCFKSSL